MYCCYSCGHKLGSWDGKGFPGKDEYGKHVLLCLKCSRNNQESIKKKELGEKREV